jgi:hypothetical protein
MTPRDQRKHLLLYLAVAGLLGLLGIVVANRYFGGF